MIAALMDDNDNGDKLLDATRHLCSAFSDLLKAAEPETKEVYFYNIYIYCNIQSILYAYNDYLLTAASKSSQRRLSSGRSFNSGPPHDRRRHG